MTFRTREPLTVKDGRRIAVCEVGDPDGPVVLYLHGTGSSRLEVAVYDDAASARGLRLVAWDRPGSGGSDPKPGRRVVDVLDDAAAVADAVGADRPVALGHSGGGSHVLALSADGTVVAAGVAVNPGPPAGTRYLAGLSRQQRAMIAAARDHPKLFRLLALPSEGRGGRLGAAVARRAADPSDLDVLRQPAIRSAQEAAAAEGRRQPRAFSSEALIFWHQPWGVELDRFTVPLHVFAGRNDPFAPFARLLGRAGATVQEMPGAHACHLLPGGIEQVLDVVAGLASR